MNGHKHGYTHMCLFIPAGCDMDFNWVDIEWFGTVKLKVIRSSKIII